MTYESVWSSLSASDVDSLEATDHGYTPPVRVSLEAKNAPVSSAGAHKAAFSTNPHTKDVWVAQPMKPVGQHAARYIPDESEDSDSQPMKPVGQHAVRYISDDSEDSKSQSKNPVGQHAVRYISDDSEHSDSQPMKPVGQHAVRYVSDDTQDSDSLRGEPLRLTSPSVVSHQRLNADSSDYSVSDHEYSDVVTRMSKTEELISALQKLAFAS